MYAIRSYYAIFDNYIGGDGCGLNFRRIALVESLAMLEVTPGIFLGFGRGRHP